MNINAPSKITFIIALVIALVGLAGEFDLIPSIGGISDFWVMFAGWAVLTAGCLLKGV